VSPDEVRKAADTFDPMKAIRWTVWQALAWIVHRHADRVRECTEMWRDIGPRFAVVGAALGPFRPIWEEVSGSIGLVRIDVNDVIEGWHELQRALGSGRVESSGREGATGTTCEISRLAWDDLRFHNPHVIENGGYRSVFCEPQPYWEKDIGKCWRGSAPAFLDVRVGVADMLKEFPAKAGDHAAAASRPPVSQARLASFLQETSTLEQTKPELRKLAEAKFPGNHVSHRAFNEAYKAIHSSQRRGRGDTGRTLKKDNRTKG